MIRDYYTRLGLLVSSKDMRALLLPFFTDLLVGGSVILRGVPGLLIGEGGAVKYIGAGTWPLSLACAWPQPFSALSIIFL